MMNYKTLAGTVMTTLLILGVLAAGYRLSSIVGEKRSKITQTRAKVERWADKLDGMTNENGVYQRWEGNTLPENDAWDNPLQVDYTQGGVAEEITVRSLGPDGQSHTNDDIATIRFAANLKGIGNGIKNNIEETSENGAKGLAKGFIQGVKESIGKKDEK
jgi:hypothetical protein